MIKKYPWDDSYATGEPAIDLQHKQFFVVLFEFAEKLEQGKGAKELSKLLIFLKYYGEWHFGREEKSVACFNCPMACENIDAHKNYMVTIDSLLEQIRCSGTSEELANSSYGLLTDWLVNHIMKIDKANADFIRAAKGEKVSVSEINVDE